MRQLMLDLWLAGFQFVLGVLSALFYFGCVVALVLLAAGLVDYVLYRRRMDGAIENHLASGRRPVSDIPTNANGEEEK